MGTNYYIKGYDTEKNDGEHINPKWHIGKRSAAGHYCFDCDITLCKGGSSDVHYGEHKWHDKCPRCGKAPIKEAVCHSSAGLELGFNKNDTKLKEGVASACSFSFAMTLIKLVERIKEEFGKSPNNKKVIVNDYGEEFTYIDFLHLLKPIPSSLRFRKLLGKEFC